MKAINHQTLNKYHSLCIMEDIDIDTTLKRLKPLLLQRKNIANMILFDNINEERKEDALNAIEYINQNINQLLQT